MLPDWKGAVKKEKCLLQPVRAAERCQALDSSSSWVENSATRLCAWVLIPLVSGNVLNTMRQNLQQTNSVILERQFKMTVPGKRKQKIATSSVAYGRAVQKCTKKKIPSRDMWNTNVSVRLNANLSKGMTNRRADHISESKTLPNWKCTDVKEKCPKK